MSWYVLAFKVLFNPSFSEYLLMYFWNVNHAWTCNLHGFPCGIQTRYMYSKFETYQLHLNPPELSRTAEWFLVFLIFECSSYVPSFDNLRINKLPKVSVEVLTIETRVKSKSGFSQTSGDWSLDLLVTTDQISHGVVQFLCWSIKDWEKRFE